MSNAHVEAGDFLEITTPRGFAYIRFFGRLDGPVPLDMFAVLDNADWSEVDDDYLPQLKTRYFLGACAKYLSADSRFKRRPGPDLAGLAGPSRWRISRLKGWRIVRDGIEGRPSDRDDDTAKLPILEILPSDLIIERLLSDWSPEVERSDSGSELLRAILDSKRTSDNKRIAVFLDFETAEETQEAADALLAAGFETKAGMDRRSLSVTTTRIANDRDWILDAECEILTIAGPHGSRYAENEVEL